MSEKSLEVLIAISKITADLAEIGIAKNRKNQQQNYAFRGIDDVYAALSPLLVKHKLIIMPIYSTRTITDHDTKSGGTTFRVTLEGEMRFISTIDGSEYSMHAFGEAMDSGDKATGKAMSGMYKTVIFQVFCVPTIGDNDTENHTHVVAPKPSPAAQAATPATIPLATEEQTIQLGELLSVVPMPEGWGDSCLKRAGVQNWRQMPADKMAKCIQVVIAKQKKGGK